MCVAATDDRNVAFTGDRSDLLPVFGVLSVDLDRVEIGVALPERTVPERVRDDRDAVAVVSDRDRLRRLQLPANGPGRRIRTDDEQVPSRRGDLDTGETPFVCQRLRPEEVVVRDRNPVQPASARGRERQARADRVVSRRDVGGGVEKRLCVWRSQSNTVDVAGAVL